MKEEKVNLPLKMEATEVPSRCIARLGNSISASVLYKDI